LNIHREGSRTIRANSGNTGEDRGQRAGENERKREREKENQQKTAED
jgi:hypothetical protein